MQKKLHEIMKWYFILGPEESVKRFWRKLVGYTSSSSLVSQLDPTEICVKKDATVHVWKMEKC